MSSLNNNTIPLFSQEKLAKSHSFCFSIIPHSNESKNIQFFSKHWKIKDPEAQNLNLIQHLESGWVFGWYNR